MAQPVSLYRVQISPDFDLRATAELASYLAALGVTHLYASPLLQAAPGSLHGYDVADPSVVDAERGGEAGLRALQAALVANRLGMVADIVPNHVGVAVEHANPAWWDLLRYGPGSRYARWFDVDWGHSPRVVLPVLDDSPDALDDLTIVDDELHYFDRRFPIAPGTGAGTPREVHERQHYRLVSGRAGNVEVNYRRFFAVSGLAAVRVEDVEVFDAIHQLVLDWAESGLVDGIRVDHPDGLADPAGYLTRLDASTPAGTWVVVEKILEHGESLPAGWRCAGTTGYDALRVVCGVFVDQTAERAFTELDAELTGASHEWAELVHSCKRAVATGILRAEVRRLTALAQDPPGDPDETHPTAAPGQPTDSAAEQSVQDALVELLAGFPVYRSYLPTGIEHLDHAAAEATRRRPDLAEVVRRLHARLVDPRDELAVRFPQVSGAVMAKGVEDTAFYRYTRFSALNEVGGDPTAFGVSPEGFHAAAHRRQRDSPAELTTLSTHDTKRAEDVRARLAVLSELPGEWAQVSRRWNRLAPCGAFGHLLWQTAVGTWPIERGRLHDYCTKAMREAGHVTSWDDPDPDYEDAVHRAVDRIYDDADLRREVAEFAARITPAGWSNSLGQKLVQLTMPGVPDVYQGCELWDNSLVDPDNRRPVDFAARRALLARLDEAAPGPDASSVPSAAVPPVDASGAAKLLVVSRALRLRRDQPHRFTSYTPLAAVGAAAQHVLAFDRGGVIAVVTRLPVGLARDGGWRDTAIPLPPGRWSDVLTGTVHDGDAAVPLGTLLDRLPVALLNAAG